jgi:CBS-domain-containing membrane protein
MMYSLSSAPASQPRNAILGQALSIAIGMGFSYATSIPVWLRVNLATAFAVAVMSKLAIIHPPAGAAAFSFASGSLGWGTMVVFMVGYIVTIAISMFLNNWSVERQYPIYWGVPGATQGGKAVKAVQTRLVREGKGKDDGHGGGAGDSKKV